MAAFCSKHGVSVSSFYGWRRRFGAPSSKHKPRSKARGTGRSNRPSKDPGQDHSKDPSTPRSHGEGRFVRAEAANPLADRVEVVWPSGVLIRVPVSYLEQVMRLVARDGSC